MSNLSLIIKREYLVRVRKRAFILTTLLTPIGIALFYGIVILMVMYRGDEALKIAVLDEGSLIHISSDSTNNLVFHKETTDLASLRNTLSEKGYDGVLQIPAIDDPYSERLALNYYSDKTPSIEVKSSIENWVEDFVENYKMQALELDSKKLAALNTNISIDPQPLDDRTEDTASSMSSEIGAGIAFTMGMLMFFVISIYGGMVMRGVMEEKTNRIVEVMISSVKPFDLMLGKIIGIGLVGLTQMLIWLIFIPLVLFVLSVAFGLSGTEMPTDMNMPNAAATEFSNPNNLDAINQVYEEVMSQNWALIIPSILIFFLGGYFMYSSLFAAVGSAIGDDLGESQSLTLPIMLPVILAFYLTIFIVVRSPDSSISVWSSLFPLFSPIVMPGRMAFDPPIWQVLLSLVLLIATSIFFVWLSARIYRVGILLYGKKNNFREIWKWMFYKG